MRADQSTRLKEIVLVDRRPEKVLEEEYKGQLIHYFYWLLDFYKPHDYEPVKVCEIEGEKAVLTRLHRTGLVVWHSPVLRDDKPLVTFTLAVHTPIVLSRDWSVMLSKDKSELTIEERFVVKYFISSVVNFLKKKLDKTSLSKFTGYSDLIVDEKPPSKYLFRPARAKYFILVGKEPEAVRAKIENLIESEKEAE